MVSRPVHFLPGDENAAARVSFLLRVFFPPFPFSLLALLHPLVAGYPVTGTVSPRNRVLRLFSFLWIREKLDWLVGDEIEHRGFELRDRACIQKLSTAVFNIIYTNNLCHLIVLDNLSLSYSEFARDNGQYNKTSYQLIFVEPFTKTEVSPNTSSAVTGIVLFHWRLNYLMTTGKLLRIVNTQCCTKNSVSGIVHPLSYVFEFPGEKPVGGK